MKLTSLLQLVDELRYDGKIKNLQHGCFCLLDKHCWVKSIISAQIIACIEPKTNPLK